MPLQYIKQRILLQRTNYKARYLSGRTPNFFQTWKNSRCDKFAAAISPTRTWGPTIFCFVKIRTSVLNFQITTFIGHMSFVTYLQAGPKCLKACKLPISCFSCSHICFMIPNLSSQSLLRKITTGLPYEISDKMLCIVKKKSQK